MRKGLFPRNPLMKIKLQRILMQLMRLLGMSMIINMLRKMLMTNQSLKMEKKMNLRLLQLQ